MGKDTLLIEEGKNRLYLDVETDFSGRVCVIGIARSKTEFFQLYGEDVISQNLERIVCKGEVIVTFNGDRFDLPIIKRQLHIDLKTSHTNVDLCKIKRKMGIKGGLKDLERIFGIRRKTFKLSGKDAPFLWERYVGFGDRSALHLLLEYNREDVISLIDLEHHLKSILDGAYDREIRDRV